MCPEHVSKSICRIWEAVSSQGGRKLFWTAFQTRMSRRVSSTFSFVFTFFKNSLTARSFYQGMYTIECVNAPPPWSRWGGLEAAAVSEWAQNLNTISCGNHTLLFSSARQLFCTSAAFSDTYASIFQRHSWPSSLNIGGTKNACESKGSFDLPILPCS